MAGKVTDSFVLPPTFPVVLFLRNTVREVLGRVPDMSCTLDKW